MRINQNNDVVYYTSEEFLLYKTTADKRTIHFFIQQTELLTGTDFFNYCTASTFKRVLRNHQISSIFKTRVKAA